MRFAIALPLLLAGCGSYTVHCTPDGGMDMSITSAREVQNFAAIATPGCGLAVQMGSASGAQSVLENGNLGSLLGTALGIAVK